MDATAHAKKHTPKTLEELITDPHFVFTIFSLCISLSVFFYYLYQLLCNTNDWRRGDEPEETEGEAEKRKKVEQKLRQLEMYQQEVAKTRKMLSESGQLSSSGEEKAGSRKDRKKKGKEGEEEDETPKYTVEELRERAEFIDKLLQKRTAVLKAQKEKEEKRRRLSESDRLSQSNTSQSGDLTKEESSSKKAASPAVASRTSSAGDKKEEKAEEEVATKEISAETKAEEKNENLPGLRRRKKQGGTEKTEAVE